MIGESGQIQGVSLNDGNIFIRQRVSSENLYVMPDQFDRVHRIALTGRRMGISSRTGANFKHAAARL